MHAPRRPLTEPAVPTRDRRSRRWAAITPLVAMALLASACTTGNSVLATSSSDDRPGSNASSTPAGELAWGECGNELASAADLECATLAVPIDRDATDGGTLDLELARSEATGTPDQRIGSLLFNPGGPGGSGIEFLAGASFTIPDELRERFDLVSWDPRGVGESSPVLCLDDQEKDAQIEGDISPDTQAEVDRAVEDQAAFVDGCVDDNAEVIEHMSTADVAGDLEEIRIALGDDELNYVGFSYGTAIGATYATMFPDAVRAMVLDGSVSPTADELQLGVTQAQGFERTYLNFIRTCDADPQCALSGSTAASVDAVRQQLDAEPLAVDTAGGTREMTRDLFDIGLATALYDTTVWGPLARSIAEIDSGGAALLLTLADQQFGRNADGTWDNSWDAQAMVNCADSEYRPSVDEALADGQTLADASPTFGETFRTSALGCVDWPLAANPVPDWTAAGAPPILVVGTVGDPATPYSWSEEMAAALEGAVLLTYEGDGHTAFLRGGACIDDAVVAYLVDLTLPAAGTSCPSVAAEGGGSFDGVRELLIEEIQGAGLTAEQANCVVDALEAEFGVGGLEQLLLSNDVDAITDATVRATTACLAGGS